MKERGDFFSIIKNQLNVSFVYLRTRVKFRVISLKPTYDHLQNLTGLYPYWPQEAGCAQVSEQLQVRSVKVSFPP